MALARRLRADDDTDPVARDRHACLLFWRSDRGLDIVRQAAPKKLASFLCVAPPRFEAVPVGETQGVVHVLFVAAAVVKHSDGVSVWHRFRPDQIAPAQSDTIYTEPRRGDIDQTLDRKGDLGTPGAAIGLGGNGVGKYRHGLQRSDRNVVAARDQARAFAQGRKRNASGADIADVGRTQRQKPATLIERQLELSNQIAALVIT